MATDSQANKARDEFADRLLQDGAHAVGVEKCGGISHYVVVAYVEPGKEVAFPESLPCVFAGVSVEVPLIIRRAEMFSAA